ncbi:MAG: phosphoribosylglycinamide formyltransferase [Chloroflexi bacterium]|nr:phosphoribosylglycinamide formyltransferase [Chloroflexota bacterium]
MKKIKLAVMVSGRGSNLQAIIDYVERGDLPAEIALVVSNRANAQAVERARRHGITSIVFERSDYPSRLARDLAMTAAIEDHGVDLVVMAGYDQLVADELLVRFAGQIINIHPSLLPAFAGGLHAQADAWEYGVKLAGCTVHFVTPGPADGGQIILQKAIPVLEEDTAETLAQRILAEEHKLLPEGIRLFAEGRLELNGRRVRIKPVGSDNLYSARELLV